MGVGLAQDGFRPFAISGFIVPIPAHGDAIAWRSRRRHRLLNGKTGAFSALVEAFGGGVGLIIHKKMSRTRSLRWRKKPPKPRTGGFLLLPLSDTKRRLRRVAPLWALPVESNRDSILNGERDFG